MNGAILAIIAAERREFELILSAMRPRGPNELVQIERPFPSRRIYGLSTGVCKCGRTISVNKADCRACAQSES